MSDVSSGFQSWSFDFDSGRGSPKPASLQSESAQRPLRLRAGRARILIKDGGGSSPDCHLDCKSADTAFSEKAEAPNITSGRSLPQTIMSGLAACVPDLTIENSEYPFSDADLEDEAREYYQRMRKAKGSLASTRGG